MRDNIQAIEEGLAINAINLKQMLKRHSDELYLNTIAEEFNIDKAVLNFLIHTSIQPSINANVEKLKSKVDLKSWLRGYCPVCGSTPCMSELKGEGERYFLCSFCGFQWAGDVSNVRSARTGIRKTPLFYEEGKRYRVDVWTVVISTLRQWTRKLGYEPDLVLKISQPFIWIS
jgi:hypothetical protein